mmetsp:Transcript_31711/g.80087  ORF Transcript_31711/g.80087 Transcript_31711/m.80087 type:complete len:543 (-) Transcript_31711:281-1909(-)
MAAVDFYSTTAASTHVTAPATVSGVGAAEFTCNACGENFATAVEQRAHCKTERHVYNTKRRLAGLKPISQEAWERKLKESRGAAGAAPNKGTAHLKAGKSARKASSETATETPSSSAAAAEAPAEPKDAAKEDEPPFSPRRCLFDRQHFDDLEECLKYMWKTYDFYIPDREYCTDVPGLLESLWHKIAEEPHACMFCNKKFHDAGSVRRHMLDMRHTRIGTEARTRRGGTDEAASEELKADLEEFYDFHGSTREITERINDPREKAACLLRFFDSDRDGRLCHAELAALWAAASSAADGKAADLSEALYAGACAKAGVDPKVGLDTEALSKLYAEGLADVDAHFVVLQDLLAKKLKTRSKDRRRASPGENEKIDEEVAEGEESEEEDGDGEDDGEEGDDTDSDTDVLECDDEEEFEEVMRVLGLQAASISETGDLRLPNGATAAHRDVAYIYRQRGQRKGEIVLADGGRVTKNRATLMLSNSPAGVAKLALTQRQQAREGKRIIAVLRRQADEGLKQGMRNNTMQRKTLKMRTGFGDASGGR